MASDYPGALDVLGNPTSTTPMNDGTYPHAQQHIDANDAIEAIQATLGIDPQGVEATVADRLDTIESLSSAGLILQVVQGTYSTNTPISSTSYTATGLSQAITPASASSRILVQVVLNARMYTSATSDREAGVRLKRGSTVVHTNDSALVANAAGGVSSYVNAGGTIVLTYVDSPATASSVTYSVEGKVSSTANSTTLDCQYLSGASIIILTELAS